MPDSTFPTTFVVPPPYVDLIDPPPHPRATRARGWGGSFAMPDSTFPTTFVVPPPYVDLIDPPADPVAEDDEPTAEDAPLVDDDVTEESLRYAELDSLPVDDYGRLRVRDEDTGHERTIAAGEYPHGRYLVLDEDASDAITGEPLPPSYADTPESLSNESGQ